MRSFSIQKIADTPEYDAVPQELFTDLDNTGHMEQIVAMQSFQELSDAENIKIRVAQVMETLKKYLFNEKSYQAGLTT